MFESPMTYVIVETPYRRNRREVGVYLAVHDENEIARFLTTVICLRSRKAPFDGTRRVPGTIAGGTTRYFLQGATAPPPGHAPSCASNVICWTRSEVERVQELLERSDVPLVTLTGPGGVGKTRIAIQAVSSAPHRPRLWTFRTCSRRLVLPAIADALGVHPAGRPVLDSLRTIFETATSFWCLTTSSRSCRPHRRSPIS